MFVGADLKNIEGRLNAWFADEEWKLQAFRDFDNGTGADLYNIAYSRGFGVPLEQIDKPKRQIGKVMELALGYQGGAGAFINMGKNYGLKPQSMVGPVRDTVLDADWEAMAPKYRSARDKHGLARDQWTAIKLTVAMWREANAKITASWWALNDAVIEAVSEPERIVPVLGGKVKYLATKGFLWCSLPSGRAIAYCKPLLKREVEVLWKDRELGDADVPESDFFAAELREHIASGRLHSKHERHRRYVDYMVRNEKGMFARDVLFGGILCNHVVQGTARDMLVECIEGAEARGYPVVLHTHDEVLTEVPRDFGSVRELEEIMSTVPHYLRGLPLAASGWSGMRYEK